MTFEGLASIGRKLPPQAVELAPDDEAAVLLAEGATHLLSDWFVLPLVPQDCRASSQTWAPPTLLLSLGVPTPEAFFPENLDDVESYAVHEPSRVVAKIVDRGAAAQPSGRRYDRHRLAKDAPASRRKLAREAKGKLQEYIHRHHAEDWIFHGYCGPRRPISGCVHRREGPFMRGDSPQRHGRRIGPQGLLALGFRGSRRSRLAIRHDGRTLQAGRFQPPARGSVLVVSNRGRHRCRPCLAS